MEKKSELSSKYDKLYKSSGKIRTKQYQRYLDTFGVSCTIINLSEVSGYSIDEIWLFDCETLEMEVRKYNMKSNADSKEMEAHQKELELKYKTMG